MATTVLKFFGLLTDLSKDPEMGMQALEAITTGQTQEIQMNLITDDRKEGLIQTGDDLYYVIAVEPIEQRDALRIARVEACSDSSGSDLVHQENGKSALGPDRAYFVEWDIEVLYEGSKWRVGDITSESVEACGP